jgi:hypothetical protein
MDDRFGEIRHMVQEFVVGHLGDFVSRGDRQVSIDAEPHLS